MEQPLRIVDTFQGHYKPIKYSDLPWEEKATLMWSWYWRAFIIGVLTIWLSNFFGGLFFMYIKKLVGDMDPLVFQAIAFIVAAMIGYLGTHALIQLITGSKVGNYQIIILRKTLSQ